MFRDVHDVLRRRYLAVARVGETVVLHVGAFEDRSGLVMDVR